VLKPAETRGFDRCKSDYSRPSDQRTRFQIAFNIWTAQSQIEHLGLHQVLSGFLFASSCGGTMRMLSATAYLANCQHTIDVKYQRYIIQ
jgi:hypothetical protein